MRTTVTLEPDVAAAVESLRHERHVGVSAAINELIRSGLERQLSAREPFEQQTSSMGALIDIANCARETGSPSTSTAQSGLACRGLR